MGERGEPQGGVTMDKRELEKLLERAIAEFAFRYVGGGYFRDRTVALSKPAKILHGEEVLARFCAFLLERCESETGG